MSRAVEELPVLEEKIIYPLKQHGHRLYNFCCQETSLKKEDNLISKFDSIHNILFKIMDKVIPCSRMIFCKKNARFLGLAFEQSHFHPRADSAVYW